MPKHVTIAFCVLLLLLLVGCSGAPSDIGLAPAPFLAIPIARNASHEISQGWFYSPDEESIHPGIPNHFAADLREPWGTPVYAPADGVAVASYHLLDITDSKGRTIGFGLGLFIAIWHEGAGVYSSYAHLSGINNALIPYIAPVKKDGVWQLPAIYLPVEDFKRNAERVKRGDWLGNIGYTGLRCGYDETPANPPTVDPKVDKTWDPAGAHLHWEVYTRTPDGSKKDKRYDPFDIYGYREAYGEVFTNAMGLILANPDGSPQFAH